LLGPRRAELLCHPLAYVREPLAICDSSLDLIANSNVKRKRLRSAHIGARARVDLDRFAFPDEKRNVDRFPGL